LELENFIYSLSISVCYGNVSDGPTYSCMMTETYSVSEVLCLEGKPEGKRPIVRPKRRWEGNIKLDIL